MGIPRSSETRWSDVGAVALVLVGGSLIPLPFRRRPAFGRFGPDKALHFLGHFGLAATVADALDGDGFDPARSGVLAVVGTVTIALGTGELQRYVPGRAPERADHVAGALGSVFGVLWWYTPPKPREAAPPPSEGG